MNLNLKKVFLLGYGSVGKCFAEIFMKNHKNTPLVVLDKNEFKEPNKKFQYIQKKISPDNIMELNNYLQPGDTMIDLSCDIDVMETWSICMNKGVTYLNTSMENWEENDDLVSYPKDLEEMYNSTEGARHDSVTQHSLWNREKGTSSIFEFGMNPGVISHFAKKGLLEAAEYFLTRADWTDLNKEKIRKYASEKNFPKLAQEMGLHTIHSTEQDTQQLLKRPEDLKTKLYNTWSCRGLITEQLVPMQVACGSHEDLESEDFPRLRNNTLISSWGPGYLHSGNIILLDYLIIFS